MDAAKAAINKLTSSHGHHTTEVTEHYNPAVTHEHVAPTREHRDTTVIDNEIHQEHHHTSVLPIKDQEVLPTEHKHNLAAAKHTEHQHGDHEGIRNKVSAELAGFKSHTEVGSTEKTHTVAPTVAGEHHHHHVHETIQPVIQKQTIQPSVVHTTIPVHEVHHNEPKHYTASALPAVSLEEFKSQGGSLTGLADRVERFEGEPENIAQKGLHGAGHTGQHSSTTGTTAGTGGFTGSDRTSAGTTTGTSGLTGSDHTSTGLGSGHNSSGLGSGHHSTGLGDNSHTGDLSSRHNETGLGGERSRAQQAIDSRVDGPGNHHSTGHTGSVGTTGVGSTSGLSSDKHNLSNTTSHASTTSKPSLLNKLNPFKDADGDGKKGLMD